MPDVTRVPNLRRYKPTVGNGRWLTRSVELTEERKGKSSECGFKCDSPRLENHLFGIFACLAAIEMNVSEWREELIEQQEMIISEA